MNETPRASSRLTSRHRDPAPLRAIHRGDVRWIKPADPEGNIIASATPRPAVILTPDPQIHESQVATIAYMTGSLRKASPEHLAAHPSHVRVTTSSRRPSVVVCEQVMSVPTSRVLDKLCVLSDDDMDRIAAAVNYSLGFTETQH